MRDIFQPHGHLPSLFSKEVRKSFLYTVLHAAVFTVLIIILVCVVTGFYSGSSFYLYENTNRLGVAIVNRDGHFFGNYIQDALISQPTLGWQVLPNLTDPVRYVSYYKAWIAIVIPHSFTKNLNDSIFTGAKYINSPIDIINEQGRSYTGNRFAIAILNATFSAITVSIQQMLLTNYTRYMKSADPTLIISPLPLTFTTLHPVITYGENVASAFTIFLISSLSMANVLNNLRIYTGLYGKVNIHQAFWWRVMHSIFNAFILSLGISIIVLAFGTHFEKGWISYWMFMWLIMLAIGGVVALINQIFSVYTPIVYPIFLLITYSGAGAVIPLALSPPFFNYGVVLPLYHAVAGEKYIIFGTGEIGLSIGVLLIYIFGTLISNYLFYLYGIWKAEIRKKKALEGQKIVPMTAENAAVSQTSSNSVEDSAIIPSKRINGVRSFTAFKAIDHDIDIIRRAISFEGAPQLSRKLRNTCNNSITLTTPVSMDSKTSTANDNNDGNVKNRLNDESKKENNEEQLNNEQVKIGDQTKAESHIETDITAQEPSQMQDSITK